MAKRPGTNDRRKVDQPFSVDRLPVEVRDAIEYLYTKAGKTWDDIADMSGLKYSPDWQTKGGGFVPWDDLSTSVLELFPDLRIPRSNMHRWYKVRIAQAGAATLERAEYARQLAQSFVGASVKGDQEAVLNAARDIFFGILTEDGSLASRTTAGMALLELSKQQQKSRTNDIRERQVSTDERKVRILEERERVAISKLEAESAKLTKKKGPITKEDVKRLRERVFGPSLKKDDE